MLLVTLVTLVTHLDPKILEVPLMKFLPPFDAHFMALDILVSSGVQVDTVHDDFASYYEMFAFGEFDKW